MREFSPQHKLRHKKKKKESSFAIKSANIHFPHSEHVELECVKMMKPKADHGSKL